MKKLLLFICVCLLVSAGTANAAAGGLMWSNTLESDATSTVDGGAIVGTSNYVSGAVGNAFEGDGSTYATWDNAEIAAIFDAGWDHSEGWTIDLYFRGDHWDTHSGDSGLWTVTDRYGGQDGYIMASVRDGSLRFPLKDSYSGADGTQHLTGVTLLNDHTYHLVVQQLGTNFEVFLDGSSVYTATLSQTISFPAPESHNPSPPPTREMRVGSRAVFGGELQDGEWVDEINIYNGVPEPATIMMLGLGGLALIRRRKA